MPILRKTNLTKVTAPLRRADKGGGMRQRWGVCIFLLVMSLCSMYALGYKVGKWDKHRNESGIFVEFHKGMIAPYGMTPYIDIHNSGHWARVYRTGEVYEVIDHSPEMPEFHRLNYWVKTHN